MFFQSLNMSSKEAEERKRARTNNPCKSPAQKYLLFKLITAKYFQLKSGQETDANLLFYLQIF